MVIERSSKPSYTLLGRAPETDLYRSIDDIHTLFIHPSITIVRFLGALNFASAEYFVDLIMYLEYQAIEKNGVIY